LKGYYGDVKPTVPLLLHKEKPIFESLDIMDYLEKFSTHHPLSPTDFRKWGDWSAGEFRDAIQLYKYSDSGEGAKKVMKGFEALESALHPFLTGDKLALADFAVWPFVRQAMRVEPQLITLGPKLEKWFATIEGNEKLVKLMVKKQSS